MLRIVLEAVEGCTKYRTGNTWSSIRCLNWVGSTATRPLATSFRFLALFGTRGVLSRTPLEDKKASGRLCTAGVCERATLDVGRGPRVRFPPPGGRRATPTRPQRPVRCQALLWVSHLQAVVRSLGLPSRETAVQCRPDSAQVNLAESAHVSCGQLRFVALREQHVIDAARRTRTRLREHDHVLWFDEVRALNSRNTDL